MESIESLKLELIRSRKAYLVEHSKLCQLEFNRLDEEERKLLNLHKEDSQTNE
ncbi:hypothetical protein [Paenibacillus cucumis (ex Kampfer et al. 2016)]|uniref:Fur-regulated basic protein FbpA n=1 Tax=Paenibacillus cucumis (ex Kampfer et al. 2016) TaxID=1776858 RepID=A0ABS7KML7_9BACL|nr:hypothetical protein [Paenibacillus cucumis (ex Kampfer et al. 2016)]MBY0205251.1 hypothetical protein [Paenibacillus cucumis (ex Kampfer et al. 2016)]